MWLQQILMALNEYYFVPYCFFQIFMIICFVLVWYTSSILKCNYIMSYIGWYQAFVALLIQIDIAKIAPVLILVAESVHH